MKMQIRILFTGLLLLAVSLACKMLAGGSEPGGVTSSGELEFNFPTPTPMPTAVTSCPAITDEAIRLALVENAPDRNQPLLDNVLLVRYKISDEELSDPLFNPDAGNFEAIQKDVDNQERVWNYFKALIPFDQRKFLSEFIISSDGKSGLLAAVAQTNSNPEKWVLMVDLADTNNPYELTYTFIHEFGHLVTLNPEQVPPSLEIFKHPDDRTTYFQELAACFTYFPGEGCSNPGSYIDDFYNEFWLDIYDEWNKIEFEPDDEQYVESMMAFYEKYQDRFVTDYAVTRPSEDIAESFTFFILSQKPAGNTISEKKILFFYDYPELVALRDVILQNVCQNFPQ